MAASGGGKDFSAEALTEADKAGERALLDFFADFQKLGSIEAVRLLNIAFLGRLFRIAEDEKRGDNVRANALIIIGNTLPQRSTLIISHMWRTLEEIQTREMSRQSTDGTHSKVATHARMALAKLNTLRNNR